jgi:hypothetical protein
VQINIFFTNHFNEKIKDENITNKSLEEILLEISKEVNKGNRSGKVSDLCKDEYFIINAEYEIIESNR